MEQVGLFETASMMFSSFAQMRNFVSMNFKTNKMQICVIMRWIYLTIRESGIKKRGQMFARCHSDDVMITYGSFDRRIHTFIRKTYVLLRRFSACSTAREFHSSPISLS
jgi:hypothetical protein